MSSSHAPIFRLTQAELGAKWIAAEGTLLEAVEAFLENTDLRLLPLLDADRRPVGAIFERDIRRLLLNPFGHALLRNPSINSNLFEWRRTCPVMELSDDIGALTDHYRAADGRSSGETRQRGRSLAERVRDGESRSQPYYRLVEGCINLN